MIRKSLLIALALGTSLDCFGYLEQIKGYIKNDLYGKLGIQYNKESKQLLYKNSKPVCTANNENLKESFNNAFEIAWRVMNDDSEYKKIIDRLSELTDLPSLGGGIKSSTWNALAFMYTAYKIKNKTIRVDKAEFPADVTYNSEWIKSLFCDDKSAMGRLLQKSSGENDFERNLKHDFEVYLAHFDLYKLCTKIRKARRNEKIDFDKDSLKSDIVWADAVKSSSNLFPIASTPLPPPPPNLPPLQANLVPPVSSGTMPPPPVDLPPPPPPLKSKVGSPKKGTQNSTQNPGGATQSGNVLTDKSKVGDQGGLDINEVKEALQNRKTKTSEGGNKKPVTNNNNSVNLKVLNEGIDGPKTSAVGTANLENGELFIKDGAKNYKIASGRICRIVGAELVSNTNQVSVSRVKIEWYGSSDNCQKSFTQDLFLYVGKDSYFYLADKNLEDPANKILSDEAFRNNSIPCIAKGLERKNKVAIEIDGVQMNNPEMKPLDCFEIGTAMSKEDLKRKKEYKPNFSHSDMNIFGVTGYNAGPVRYTINNAEVKRAAENRFSSENVGTVTKAVLLNAQGDIAILGKRNGDWCLFETFNEKNLLIDKNGRLFAYRKSSISDSTTSDIRWGQNYILPVKMYLDGYRITFDKAKGITLQVQKNFIKDASGKNIEENIIDEKKKIVTMPSSTDWSSDKVTLKIEANYQENKDGVSSLVFAHKEKRPDFSPCRIQSAPLPGKSSKVEQIIDSRIITLKAVGGGNKISIVNLGVKASDIGYDGFASNSSKPDLANSSILVTSTTSKLGKTKQSDTGCTLKLQSYYIKNGKSINSAAPFDGDKITTSKEKNGELYVAYPLSDGKAKK